MTSPVLGDNTHPVNAFVTRVNKSYIHKYTLSSMFLIFIWPFHQRHIILKLSKDWDTEFSICFWRLSVIDSHCFFPECFILWNILPYNTVGYYQTIWCADLYSVWSGLSIVIFKEFSGCVKWIKNHNWTLFNLENIWTKDITNFFRRL